MWMQTESRSLSVSAELRLVRPGRDMFLNPVDVFLLFYHLTSEPRAEHQARRERKRQAKRFLKRGQELLSKGSVDEADIRFDLALRLCPDIVNHLSRRQCRRLEDEIAKHCRGRNATQLRFQLDKRGPAVSNYGQPTPKLYSCDPPIPPPGKRPTCSCFNFRGNKHHGLPVLHAEIQDTSCAAWRIVIEDIELAAIRGDTILDPLARLDGEQRQQVITLPASVGELKRVRELRLYGSHLVRLPPQIAGMTSLEYLDVYTSYRLHFFPYEITGCRALKRSRASTRALYGNYKHRPPFPHVKLPENSKALSLLTPSFCSVCAEPIRDSAPVRRWITLLIGSDYLPLLVTACSMKCIRGLPTPPQDYVQEAHTGGLHIAQPPARR